MSWVFSNKIMVLFFCLMSMNFLSGINKDVYRQHYKPFEAYVFEKRTLVEPRKIPFIGQSIVSAGAGAYGYDAFAIPLIPLAYPLFDRKEDDIKRILGKIESDACIDLVNKLLVKCSQKPADMSDLNWAIRVTYAEGKRLEQEKLQKSGQAASPEEKDTYMAVSFLVRYLVKNKIS